MYQGILKHASCEKETSGNDSNHGNINMLERFISDEESSEDMDEHSALKEIEHDIVSSNIHVIDQDEENLLNPNVIMLETSSKNHRYATTQKCYECIICPRKRCFSSTAVEQHLKSQVS
jgi:hypothetical protein